MRQLLLALAFFLGAALNLEAQQTVPLEPHPAYAELWAEVTECAGPYADPAKTFEEIKWFWRSPVLDPAGNVILGEWVPPDTIYVTVGLEGSSYVVAHELLHHRINGPPDYGVPNFDPHPWEPFAFPCKLMDFQQGTQGIMAARAPRGAP